MNTSNLTNTQIRVLGWEALIKRLGPSGALRFAVLTEAGLGGYAETRHRLLGSLSVDELIVRMKASRGRKRRR